MAANKIKAFRRAYLGYLFHPSDLLLAKYGAIFMS